MFDNKIFQLKFRDVNCFYELDVEKYYLYVLKRVLLDQLLGGSVDGSQVFTGSYFRDCFN